MPKKGYKQTEEHKRKVQEKLQKYRPEFVAAMAASNTVPLEERFWAKVGDATESGCREWTAARLPKGYGLIGVSGSNQLAHRVSWELANGVPVPEGLFVLHHCDNPPCVEPAHLYVGTAFDNMADKSSRGRWRGPDVVGSKNPFSKLTEEEVREIRARYTGARGDLTNLGREFGVNKTAIQKIVSRESWKHV